MEQEIKSNKFNLTIDKNYSKTQETSAFDELIKRRASKNISLKGKVQINSSFGVCKSSLSNQNKNQIVNNNVNINQNNLNLNINNINSKNIPKSKTIKFSEKKSLFFPQAMI